MTDGRKDQLKRKKTLEYELRRLYRAGELTDQQIAELKEAEFPFDAPVRRTAKSVVRIDDGKRWPSCSAAEKELGITQGWFRFRRTLIVFSLNIKPQYIPARYFSFCVLLTVLLVTLSIRSLQGKLFITDA